MSAKQKELVEKLNRLVAEAHTQAPPEAQREIEKGYGEVLQKLSRLLTVWVPAAQTTSTCTVAGMGTFAATWDQCVNLGCQGSFHKKDEGDPPPEK
jgi:hypothetical protein